MSTRPNAYRYSLLAAMTLAAFFSAPRSHLSAEPQSPAPAATAANDLQRSVSIYRYEVAGKSGSARGEVLYYYKCWVCHNSYTKGPQLKDLYKHPRLYSGAPVNDETVTTMIKNGGPRMPAFQYTLRDADLADLLTYLREGKCCYDEYQPPTNPWYRASTQTANGGPGRDNLKGGTHGVVRLYDGLPLEGIMVQLIAGSGVRTTVYTNEHGNYEFPVLPSGSYTLRIAKPLDVLPYQRLSVRIDGSTKLEDIVLQRRSNSEFLPANADVYAQLSSAEWLWNLPGTAYEKHLVSKNCGSPGCHSYQQSLRNRFDERGWRLMVDRMLHFSGSPLINRVTEVYSAEEEAIVKFLARVRGPDSKDDVPLRVFPRAHGLATRVVITEYELPRVLLAPHDVANDSAGNIWYTSHRTPFMGRLDPRTGIVTEYAVPPTPANVLPGTHWLHIDKNDIVWAAENWAHNIVRFDPGAQKFSNMEYPTERPINSPMGGNFSMTPDGYIWKAQEGVLQKFDTKNARVVQEYTLKKVKRPYDSITSSDGNFWAGGSAAAEGNTISLFNIRTGELLELETESLRSDPARGGFDLEDNPWFGGRGGSLVMMDVKARVMREYWPPTPHTEFYEAMPDKNGEVWAGELEGGRFVRFNPRTERWIEYVLPEPYSHDRRTWIDNSTNPVTVWYVDHNNYLVRIQPLE